MADEKPNILALERLKGSRGAPWLPVTMIHPTGAP
jgi:hypothetical protein